MKKIWKNINNNIYLQLYINIIYMQHEWGDGLGGRRRERGGRLSYSVTGAAGECWVAREREIQSRAGEMEGVGGRKERKEKKKKGGRGRWGAGQLGPTSKFLTCGIVPHQKYCHMAILNFFFLKKILINYSIFLDLRA